MKETDDIAKETLNILKYFDSEFLLKIPDKFLENLKQVAKTSKIIVNIDKDKKLNEQNISEECKDLISLIYYTYVANENDKDEILKYWSENEEKYQEELKKEYNVNNIFNNINKNVKEQENLTEKGKESNLPIIVEKHSFIKIIWEKIKKLIKYKS